MRTGDEQRIASADRVRLTVAEKPGSAANTERDMRRRFPNDLHRIIAFQNQTFQTKLPRGSRIRNRETYRSISSRPKRLLGTAVDDDRCRDTAVNHAQQLVAIDMLPGESTPEHVVRGGHEFYPYPTQIRVQRSGSEIDRLPGREREMIEIERREYPDIAGKLNGEALNPSKPCRGVTSARRRGHRRIERILLRLTVEPARSERERARYQFSALPLILREHCVQEGAADRGATALGPQGSAQGAGRCHRKLRLVKVGPDSRRIAEAGETLKPRQSTEHLRLVVAILVVALGIIYPKPHRFLTGIPVARLFAAGVHLDGECALRCKNFEQKRQLRTKPLGNPRAQMSRRIAVQQVTKRDRLCSKHDTRRPTRVRSHPELSHGSSGAVFDAEQRRDPGGRSPRVVLNGVDQGEKTHGGMVDVGSPLVNAVWSSPPAPRILRAMISQPEFASLSVEQRIGLLYPDSSPVAVLGRIADLVARFADQLGRIPSARARIVSAPGRTEIAGNHTDHNNGLVIAASVQLDVLGIVEPRADRVVTVHSHGYPKRFTVEVSERAARDEERGRFESMVRGVAAGLATMGIEPVGFDCCMHSTVAAGSGLSSSAAVEVFLTAAFCAAANRDLPDPVATAILCREAENHYFGKPCGLMDQIACAHGGAVAIDFADASAPAVTALDFSPADHGLALVVVESGASHDDLTDEYAAVPAEMAAVARALGATTLRDVHADHLLAALPKLRTSLSERAILRAFHFLDENRRVTAQTDALRTGRVDRFLELVCESGDSSWRLLQNCAAVSHGARQELALCLALSDRLPARASRVHGGGFAGTMQAYVPREQLNAYRSEMERVMGAGAVTELFVRPVGPVVLGDPSGFRSTDS